MYDLEHLNKFIEAKKEALHQLQTRARTSPSTEREHQVEALRRELRQLVQEKERLALTLMIRASDEENENGPEGEDHFDAAFSPRAIRRALKNIHSPATLGKQPIASSIMVDRELEKRQQVDTAFNRGLVVIDLVTQAVDSLKPLTDQEESDTAAWRYYNSLQLRYLDGLGRTDTAQAMHLSLPHYDRHHRRSLKMLSEVLWGRELEAQAQERAHTPHEDLAFDNLPRRPWLFVGRECEKERILEVLDPEHRQWLTVVVGPGGIGKTTLALESAHVSKNQGMFDAVIWADARTDFIRGGYWRQKEAGISTLDHLFLLIGRVTQENLARQSQSERRAAAMDILRSRRCLIVVDSFEILEGQSEFRRFLEDDIPEPSKVIVTTRHDIIEGGRRVELDGLSRQDTVSMIRKQAKEQEILTLLKASDDTLDLIWYATGGSPLVIEWFVGQSRVLNSRPEELVEEMLDRHRDQYEHLLEFCFGRSYGMLNESAKHILSLFPFFDPVVGVAVPTLQRIAEASIEDLGSSLSILRRLSLIYPVRPGRNSILDLTRQFVLSKVSKQVQVAILAEVAEYWRDFVGRHQADYPRLSREYHNVLFAIDWCFAEEKWDLGISLVLGIGDFLYKHGHWAELLSYSTNAVEAARRSGNPEDEARLHVEHLGWIYYHLREWELCVTHSQAGLAIAEAAGARRAESLALRNLGLVQRDTGELEEAKRVFEQALAVLSSEPNESDIRAIIEGSYIVALRRLKQFDQAEELLTGELDRAKIANDLERIAMATYRMGTVAHERGDTARAEKLLNESIELDRRLERFSSVAYSYRRLSRLYRDMGMMDTSLECMRRSYDVFRAVGASKSRLAELEQEINELEAQLVREPLAQA